MMVRRLAPVALAVGLMMVASAVSAQEFQPKEPPLDTEWTDEVPLDNPRPEYPRPQLVRDDWENLNGIWEFGPRADGDPLPGEGDLEERIRVPFPIESALSGIMRINEQRSWYRRTFSVPESWSDSRVLLHFGAVTHEAVVYVNGEEVGTHRGSYDAFSFDITDSLNPSGDNELIVRVYDPHGQDGEAIGKQFGFQGGIFFSQCAGIWQTVWLEPVAEAHIERLDQTPDLERSELVVVPVVPNAGAEHTVVLTASTDGEVVGTATGAPGEEIRVPVPDPHLWSVEDPFLYDLDVELRSGDQTIDNVESYFGMRSIALADVGGVTRMVLNGEFVFHSGALDQGYWPDGLYSAPTDEALRYDIELAKRIGLNMLRKHVKVEPQRWYYWADKLGLLVWQDMPNMQIYRRLRGPEKPQYELELAEMIDELRSHPSIVVWVPFNEGWGQYDVERITMETKERDPSRLVSGNSGSANCCVAIEADSSDLRDSHLYPGPYSPKPDYRASVNTEFGGCTRRAPEHEWNPDDNGDAPGCTQEAAEGLFRRQWEALEQQLRAPGHSASTFTELYDIQQELSGIYTYDRRVAKVSEDVLAELNESLIAASRDPEKIVPVAANDVPEGQVAYFSFDEGSGDVAADGTASGHDLSLENGAAWADDGVRGSALDVRGGGEHALASGPIVDTSGSFSIAAWLRHRDRLQTKAAISQDGSSAPGFQMGLRNSDERGDLRPGYDQFPPPEDEYPPFRWTFDVPDAEGCLGDECGNRANSAYGDVGMMPPEDRWDHVVGVVDRDHKTLSIYVNGEHISSESADYDWASDGAFAVGVGSAADPTANSFDGSIDEVRVFNRALSSAEAWQVFAADGGYEPPPSGGGGGCSVDSFSSAERPKLGLLVLLVGGIFFLLLRRTWQRGAQ